MGRPHRYAGSRLNARTSLTRERVLELGRASAAATVGNAWDGRKELRLTSSRPDGDTYAIHGALLHKPHQLDFRLTVAEVGGGVRDGVGCQVATEITWYVTSQTKAYWFIPMGRATMVAHTSYVEFMQHLAQRLRAEDPAATVTVLKGEQVLSVSGAGAPAPTAPRPGGPAPSVTAPPPPDGRACAACSAVAYDEDLYCGQCGTALPAAAATPADGAVR